MAKEIIKYYTQQRGVLTFTAGIIYGFLRTRPKLAEPDVQYHSRTKLSTAATRVLDRQPGMTLTVYQCGRVEGFDPREVGRPAGVTGDPAELPRRRSWIVRRWWPA